MAAYDKTEDQMSVADLLDHSIREITSRVAAIRLSLIHDVSDDPSEWKTFLIRAKGDYAATIIMSAEDPVFYEIARNMKKKSDVSEVDIAVYVAEYYNILCGFFISAFNHRKKLKSRFGIPEFFKRKYIQNANLNPDAVSLFYQCTYGKVHICASGFPS